MSPILDELLLFAYDDHTGRNRVRALEIALGGAMLLELTLAGRVTVVGGRVRVLDMTPIGQRFPDGALRDLAAGRLRKPADVVQRIGKGMKHEVLGDLLARGVLRLETDRRFGLFDVDRYFPNDPAAKADIRLRLSSAVERGSAADARTAALASLVHALRAEHLALPNRDRRSTRRVLRAIAEGWWPGDATRKAIQDAQVAGVLALATAGTISAGGS
ncbi:GPP34 family phosphoprotein [Glycomyces halotolerans]